MAVPAAVLAAKAALFVGTDEKGRTAMASIIAAVLLPFLLVAAVILCLLSGTVSHNKSAVELAFHGGFLSSRLPADYRSYIKQMRESFTDLDTVLSEIKEVPGGEDVDGYRVKAVFYALFFGADQPRMGTDDYRAFTDCFITYEEREDEEGNICTVVVPVSSLDTVYGNLETLLGRAVTREDRINAQRIYQIALQGDASHPESSEPLPPGTALGEGSFSDLIAEATKYIGYPYVMGGSSPGTGFDCSGFVCWVYTKSGVYHLPRTTAQGIYNQCVSINREEAKPGDLIFFTRTYATSNTVSHVGIYVGSGKMLHCGSPIGYADINSSYWQAHYYGMGRLLR